MSSKAYNRSPRFFVLVPPYVLLVSVFFAIGSASVFEVVNRKVFIRGPQQQNGYIQRAILSSPPLLEQHESEARRQLWETIPRDNGIGEAMQYPKEYHHKLESIIDATENNNSTAETIVVNSEVLHLPVSVFVVVAVLAFLATLLTLISCGLVYKYREHRYVAIGQPPFLYLICLGCLLVASQAYCAAIAKYVSGDNQANEVLLKVNCVFYLWFDNLGMMIINLAIFCKLWRAFKVTRFQRNLTILPRHVIAPFVLLLMAVICLTIAETVLTPPFWGTLDFVHDDSNATEVYKREYGVCLRIGEVYESDEGGVEDVYTKTYNRMVASISILQYLGYFIVLVMAWRVRKVPEEISDSRSVCRALGTNCCIAVPLIIVYIVGLLIQGLGMMIISMALLSILPVFVFLGFLVLPKLYNACCDERRRRQEQSKSGTIVVASDTKRTIPIGNGTIRVTGAGANSTENETINNHTENETNPRIDQHGWQDAKDGKCADNDTNDIN